MHVSLEIISLLHYLLVILFVMNDHPVLFITNFLHQLGIPHAGPDNGPPQKAEHIY